MNTVTQADCPFSWSVDIDDDAWSALGDIDGIVSQAIDAAMQAMPRSGEPDRQGDISILLTDDATIARLNADHRGKSGPTNVLSFPAHESAQDWLGDIAIAHGVVMREADERSIAPRDHLIHLLIHGFLHLHGYDHIDDEDAERMEAIERRALARLDIADPYAVGGRMND